MCSPISILAAIEFIEDNLREEIAVADIAAAAGYSLYHFCRIFNEATRHTPYDYLMRRRLSEAAGELIATDRRIIDVALDYAFNNPETFSRAFKRMFGEQPNQWRKQCHIDRHCFMPQLSPEYLQHISRGTGLRPVLAEKDAFHVAGLMTPIKEDRGEAAELWEILAQEVAGLKNQVQPPRYYGIASYLQSGPEHGFFYMVGTAVEGPKVVHPTLVVKMLPRLRYARFTHQGSLQNLGLTLDYIYHTWLPKSDHLLALPLEVESFGQHLGPMGSKDGEWGFYIPIQGQHSRAQ